MLIQWLNCLFRSKNKETIPSIIFSVETCDTDFKKVKHWEYMNNEHLYFGFSLSQGLPGVPQSYLSTILAQCCLLHHHHPWLALLPSSAPQVRSYPYKKKLCYQMLCCVCALLSLMMHHYLLQTSFLYAFWKWFVYSWSHRFLYSNWFLVISFSLVIQSVSTTVFLDLQFRKLFHIFFGRKCKK